MQEQEEVVIARTAAILGNESKAVAWFRYQPLMGFDGKTANELVAARQAETVLMRLDVLDNGGFA
jgi:hypothetical protein